MTFKIDNYTVVIESKQQNLKEQIIAPSSVKNGKPSNYEVVYKTREFFVFSQLGLKHKDGNKYGVISDIFDLIDFIEMLKSFANNKLDTDKIYKINDVFTAKTAQKDKKISLQITFENWTYSHYFGKFEAASLAAKLSKILSKVEAWQDQQA